MAKKSSSAGSSKVPPKLQGKKVFLAGKYWTGEEDMPEFIKAEGGTVVDELTDEVDTMLLGYGGVANPQKKATKLNAQGAVIQVLSIGDFRKAIQPTADEAETLLKAGEIERWNRFIPDALRYARISAGNAAPTIVQHVDFQGAKLAGARLSGFDGCDFTGADLSQCQLNMTKCNLAGACLDGADIIHVSECEAAGVDFRKCDWDMSEFVKSNLAGAQFAGVNGNLRFKECDLEGADFSKANTSRSAFHKCNLKRADFSGSRHEHSHFEGSDLSGANFRAADLSMANLTGATVDGADFTDAVLVAADLTNVDMAKAKGYDPAKSQPKGAAGAAVAEFIKTAQQAHHVVTTLTVTDGDKTGVLSISLWPHGGYCNDNAGLWMNPQQKQTPADVWAIMTGKWQRATPDFGSLVVRASKSPTATKELKKLALAAWSELFGVAAPTEDELKQAAQASKAKKSEVADEWIDVLKSGKKGVERWNTEHLRLSKILAKVADIDLAGAKLAGLNLQQVEWRGARFGGADLSKCVMNGCRFPGGDFTDANLTKAILRSVQLTEAKLHGANFADAELWHTSLKRADCTNAVFAKATMANADLCGADLTGADLTGAILNQASYDEHTKWPKKFKPDLDMIWKGPGTSPAAHALVQSTKPKGKLDLDQFMKRLEELTDAAKLGKALKMLKADRFRLYAQVEDDHFVGVVKSQGDPDLVYSCRLNSDGTYACCTQNLNICGGLRGSLCKHLLVLIVGLSKGGDLDPNAIDTWIRLSQTNKPALDKDQMSETFLRYKGAEAGEVDWRPTETIPEDYYAM